MILRTLAALWRRPTPAAPVSSAPHPEFLDTHTPLPLPVRTPGIATARRHAWAAVHHALGALQDVDTFTDARLDPARAAETRVRRVAAYHQLDQALAEIRAARRALPTTSTEEAGR